MPNKLKTFIIKTHAIALLLLIAAVAARAQEAHKAYVQKSPNKIIVTSQVSPKLINEIAQGKAYLVDVRSPEEFSLKHLKYARNIDIRSADFSDKFKKLSPDKPVYLYCHSGNRSGRATDTLQTLGHLNSYNIGGMDSLIKAGFLVQ